MKGSAKGKKGVLNVKGPPCAARAIHMQPAGKMCTRKSKYEISLDREEPENMEPKVTYFLTFQLAVIPKTVQI